MTPSVFFLVFWWPLGEEVPHEEGVEEFEFDDVLGDIPGQELFPFPDMEPLRSLGDKLEFLLDDREELGLETWLPFLVGDPETPGIECFVFVEYLDLTGTGLNVVG